MDTEVMHRFEEPTVVPAFVAAPGAHGPKHLNHSLPVLSSVIRVSMVGLLNPTSQESEDQSAGNQLSNLLVPIRPHRLNRKRSRA